MYDTLEDEEDVQLLAVQARRPQRRLRAAIISGILVFFTVALLFYSAAIIQRLTTDKNPTAPRVSVPLQAIQEEEFNFPDNKDATLSRDDNPMECGSTVAIAIKRQCPFDVMSNLWTPHHCYDASFALESLNGVEVGSDGGGVGAPEFGLKEFRWFEDAERSRPLGMTHDLEQFLLQQDQNGLPLEAYTSMSFHAAHCSYLARVATRGLDRVNGGEEDVWIPEVATNPTHARHCEHVFGELYRMNETEARREWTKVGFGFSPCVRIG